MRVSRSRKGVASVVGMVFFVLVFMLAVGSLAYQSGLQAQTSSAQQDEAQTAALKASESLAFILTRSGVAVVDAGPFSVAVNHVILRYPNGTVYPLSVSATLPSGASAPLLSMVPAGLCSPGSATCLSKYTQIASGNPPGSSVGLVTSLGNAFWYTYGSSVVPWNALTAFPKPCPAGEAVGTLNTTISCVGASGFSSWVRAAVATSGTGKYSSTGLAVALSANQSYAFYVFTSVEPLIGIEKYNFEVRTLPAGASLVVACTPLSSSVGGGSQPTNCVTSAGTPIASNGGFTFGTSPPVFATPGLFGVLTVGSTRGTLEIDFACTSGCGGVTLRPGSFMLVQPLV